MSAAKKPKEPPPPELLAELADRIAREGPPRVLLARGDERLFRERAIELALAAASARGFEISRHDGHEPGFDVGPLCDDLAAAPMFASARCVLVRGVSALGKRGESAVEAFQRAASAFLADRSREGALVVDGEGLRADHALVKLATKAGGAVLTLRRLYSEPSAWDPDPRRTELARWIQVEGRARGATVRPDDAAWLAAAVGNDLARLCEALDRVAHGGSRSVRELVGWSSGGSPFDLAEELCRGDVVRALANVEALFRAGFQSQGGAREVEREAVCQVLFGTLRGKLRQSIAGARALARGASAAQAADEAGVPAWPKARAEFEARLALRPGPDWAELLDDLAALERKGRTGAEIDANDVAAFALRWRIVSRRTARAGA